MNKEEVIYALRCSCTPGSHCDKKNNCPYYLLEEIKPDFPVPADVTIDGIKYWESCNTDQMCLDAADLLESGVN